MYLSQVKPEDMPEPVRAVWEQAADGGKKFIAAMAHAPVHAERLFPYYNGVRYETLIGPKLCELLRLAIAQTTQCPICLPARRQEALDDGMTEEQVARLVTPDREVFTEAELAVVSFAYKFGADHFSIGEADFRELRRHFSEEEVTEIGMLCAQFLGFGRLVMVLGLENPSCPIPADSPAAASAASHGL
jgi:AhpD family alkylhydroperoxidase